jgi:hypothetical protein
MGKPVLGRKSVKLQSRPVCTLNGFATGRGKGLVAGFGRGFGFGEACLLAFARFGATLFATGDLVLDDADFALDDLGLALI